MFMLAALFLADEASSVFESLVEEQTYNYWGELVNMLVTLGLVIGIILFSVWMMKRLNRAKWKAIGPLQNIRVIERRALSNKSALYLVDILGKGVVIADTPAGVTLVKEFADDVDIDAIIEEKLEAEEKPRVSFGRKLISKLGLASRA